MTGSRPSPREPYTAGRSVWPLLDVNCLPGMCLVRSTRCGHAVAGPAGVARSLSDSARFSWPLEFLGIRAWGRAVPPTSSGRPICAGPVDCFLRRFSAFDHDHILFRGSRGIPVGFGGMLLQGCELPRGYGTHKLDGGRPRCRGPSVCGSDRGRCGVPGGGRLEVTFATVNGRTLFTANASIEQQLNQTVREMSDSDCPDPEPSLLAVRI